MSNLPRLAQLEFAEEELNTGLISEVVHSTLDWDFEKGDFKLRNGKLQRLQGIEYLKLWIRKALYTVRNTTIYKDTDYGSEHHSLIGTTFKLSFIKSEYERMIREALLVNNAINSVSNFNFSQTGSRMTISFDVASIYGATREDVIV